jgi:hypothetical protein
MAGGKRPTVNRANQAQTATPKKKGKKAAPATDKMAVPDVIPLIDTFSSSEKNSGLFTKSTQSVLDWSGEAMEPQAWG